MAGPTFEFDERIREFANPVQARYIDAIIQHGSLSAAARALGRNKETLRQAVKHVERRAARQGYSPHHDMTRTVPDGYVVKGVSTYYDKEGNAAGQWVKSQIDAERQAELMRAAALAMAEELPRLEPMPSPEHCSSRLCNLFTLTDLHIGGHAWHKEGGADWDLKIAEATITKCFEYMVTTAPKAKTAIVNIQGDTTHYDGLKPVTPISGHILDADGRFSKMISVAIRVMRRLCDVALMRHEVVHVIFAQGNHDESSAVWLRLMFAALYENEPRLTVNDSEIPYYVYQHGKTMIAVHHGHLKKNDQLPLLIAAQYPVMWGNTTKRYAHTGHLHHWEGKEHAGITVIRHPTLTARDAYASRGGWFSERAAIAITYHSEYGQVATTTVVPEMLEAA